MRKSGILLPALLLALLCGCAGGVEDEVGGLVQFGERMVDSSSLSQETLEWLEWYNSLPSEEQQAVSAIPPDLYEELDYPGTEDAQATVTEEETNVEELP